MDIQPLMSCSKDQLQQLLAGIPFYKEIQSIDVPQYELLLSYSHRFSLFANECLKQDGDLGQWLHFLVKGRLFIYGMEQVVGVDEPIGYITPGELVGDVALFHSGKRCSQIVADPSCREVVLVGTQFECLGGVDDFSRISLLTKLVLYRRIVHNLRWKVEVNRMRQPQHPLVLTLRKVPLYTGPRDTLGELMVLEQQAKVLADILVAWHLPETSELNRSANDQRVNHSACMA